MGKKKHKRRSRVPVTLAPAPPPEPPREPVVVEEPSPYYRDPYRDDSLGPPR